MATLGSTDGTYFDAILGEDGNVLYNGTAEETRAWMVQNVHLATPGLRFVKGESLKTLTYAEYMFPEPK
jgi:hypothetical protein